MVYFVNDLFLVKTLRTFLPANFGAVPIGGRLCYAPWHDTRPAFSPSSGRVFRHGRTPAAAPAARLYADAVETESDARTLTLYVEFLSTGDMRLLSCEADGSPIFTDLTASAPIWGEVTCK